MTNLFNNVRIWEEHGWIRHVTSPNIKTDAVYLFILEY